MAGTRVDAGTIRAALSLASRAPSIHNSQPWLWRVRPPDLVLTADLARWLPGTDADGRDLLLSCGAVLHHLQVALRGLGAGSSVTRGPFADEPGVLARVRPLPGEPGPAPAELDEAAAVRRRRSDRRRYLDHPVPEELLDDLAGCAAAHGALLRPVAPGPAREALAAAARLAVLEHLVDDEYENELARWSGRHVSDDGVPAANVPPPAPPGRGIPLRRFAAADLPDTGPAGDGATPVVLGTSSDDPLSQLRAGEALSAVLLRATVLELASCPMTEPLEVAPAREAIREHVLEGTLCPQAVVRLGWTPPGPGVPATPRRALTEQVEGLSRLRP